MEHARHDRELRRGMTGIDVVTLLAIGLVLVVVSLPRLRVLAREDNQSDAFEIALTLHRALESHPELAPDLALGASLELLVDESPVLRKRLEDVELLDGGRRLRCHGYLFDVVRTEAAGTAPGPQQLAVRAWPWHYERTGRAAYVVTPEGTILEHENRDGRFGGAGRAPGPGLFSSPGEGAQAEGWRSVKLESGTLARAVSAL